MPRARRPVVTHLSGRRGRAAPASPPSGPPGRRGAPPPTARVGGLGQLAATLPYLLGFVPHESVTFLALRERRVGLTARVDLAGVLDPLVAPALLDSVCEAVARTEASGMVVIVSSEAAPLDPTVVRRVQLAAERADLDLLDVGWHHGAVCESLLCGDPHCCPPAVTLVDAACEAVASATFAGIAPLPDRESVEAEFDRPEGYDPEALDDLIAEHETARVRDVVAGDDTAVRRAADRVLALARAHDTRVDTGVPSPPLPDEQVAECVGALADVGVRDLVWLAVDAADVDGAELWLELARRAPSPYDASPLFLLGWRAWRHGDGVRALIAAERAAATPGGYSAAGLLLDAIRVGVDPRRVPGLAG